MMWHNELFLSLFTIGMFPHRDSTVTKTRYSNQKTLKKNFWFYGTLFLFLLQTNYLRDTGTIVRTFVAVITKSKIRATKDNGFPYSRTVKLTFLARFDLIPIFAMHLVAVPTKLQNAIRIRKSAAIFPRITQASLARLLVNQVTLKYVIFDGVVVVDFILFFTNFLSLDKKKSTHNWAKFGPL